MKAGLQAREKKIKKRKRKRGLQSQKGRGGRVQMMGGSKKGIRGVSSCKRGCLAKNEGVRPEEEWSLGRVVMQLRDWRLVGG